MGLFWGTVGIALGLGLGALALVDRRSRQRGHRLRSSQSMWHDVRETRRDARAIEDGVQGAVVAGANVGWMAYFRKNSQGGRSEMGDT